MPLKNIAINNRNTIIMPLWIAKKVKKSSLLEDSLRKIADKKAPNESEEKIENMHNELIMGISEMGNQAMANLLGELVIKQKPKPVINVPSKKK